MNTWFDYEGIIGASYKEVQNIAVNNPEDFFLNLGVYLNNVCDAFDDTADIPWDNLKETKLLELRYNLVQLAKASTAAIAFLDQKEV